MESSNVATPHPAYKRQREAWVLAQALLDGTDAMRALALGPESDRTHKRQAVSENYLPKEVSESIDDYVRRVQRSFLHPGFARTVGTIASRPFSKPIALQWDGEAPELPEPLNKIEGNADRQGTNLTGFARDCFADAWSFGLCHVLVDYPSVDPATNLAAERDMDVHPYFVRIHPLDLTSWETWSAPNGEEVLTRINIRETVMDEGDDWGCEEVEQYRVLRWDPEMPAFHTVELWRKDEDGDWYLHQEPMAATHPGIPLETFYLGRTGMLEARPPLRAMMDLNVAHWQSSSDQRRSLSFARVAPIVVKGVDEDWQPRSIGYGQVWDFRSDTVQVEYLEGTGTALQAGERDLQDIEQKMEILGLQPLVERTASSTATGKEIDASNAASDAQAAVERFEGFVRNLFGKAGRWVDIDIDEDVPGFEVDVFSEFGIGFRAAQDLPFLFQMNSAGMLSHRTLLREAIRRGLLPESIDLDQEMEQAAEDSLARASMFPGIAMANEAARQQSGMGGDDEDEDEEYDDEGDEGGPPRFGAE